MPSRSTVEMHATTGSVPATDPTACGLDRNTPPLQTSPSRRGERLMTRRTARTLAAVAVVGALAATSGCDWLASQIPDVPSQSSAQPTGPASESAQDRAMRLDKEAARKAYLDGSAEYDRLVMAGGADKATKKLTDNFSGAYLKDATETIQLFKTSGWHTDRSISTKVTADQGWSASKIELTACEDSSKVRTLDKSGNEVNKGGVRLIVQTLVAKRTGDQWKIDSQTSRPVKTFDNEAGCS